MNGTQWTAVAALLAAGLGIPAATATAADESRPHQPEVVATPLTSKLAAQTVVSLTGVVAPTTEAIVAPGTLMSTYGHLRLYDGASSVVPLVHRYVHVETRPLSNPTAPYTAISTGLTTSTGYYYAGNWRAREDVEVRVSFDSDRADIPSKITYLGTVRPRPRPTWLDGVARPTSPTTVIRPDTKMSTFGHLRVLYSNGQIGPYAGQRVWVVLREADQPTTGFDPVSYAVGSALTTPTGYFYVNWTPSLRNTDVGVVLSFGQGYTSVTSATRELGVIHIQ